MMQKEQKKVCESSSFKQKTITFRKSLDLSFQTTRKKLCENLILKYVLNKIYIIYKLKINFRFLAKVLICYVFFFPSVNKFTTRRLPPIFKSSTFFESILNFVSIFRKPFPDLRLSFLNKWKKPGKTKEKMGTFTEINNGFFIIFDFVYLM